MTERTTPQEKLGVLVGGTGNIGRSPTAEGVFRHLLTQEGLQDRVAVDSAGNVLLVRNDTEAAAYELPAE